MMADQTTASITSASSEQRGAARAPIEPLTAKIVCQSGEYICRVADVSTLGVGLSFLHAVPTEPRLILQLSNDRTYPIERVWTGKRQAGYRFDGSVQVEDFVDVERDMRHRPIRLRISAPAQINDGHHQRKARLIDLSCEGARIESDEPISREGLVGLEIAGLDPRLGTVRWRDGSEVGLAFQHKLTLEELANYSMQLQPFNAPQSTGFGAVLTAASAA